MEEALYAYLVADAGVSALISNRLYPLVIPQDATLPAAAYQRISGPRVLAHDGPTGAANPRFQFTCVGEAYEDAKDVANAIRVALDGHAGTLSGVVLDMASVENETDGYYQVGEYRTVRLDVVCWHLE